MNKLPARQIYSLFIIVAGIISLSIYSTYALFTLEEATSDIVSIHTPDAMDLTTDVSEYKQLVIPKNSYKTTDIDLYNNFGYEICYSIWYNALDGRDMLTVYENNDTNTTLGVLPSVSGKRVNLYLINDSDSDIRVNLGVTYTANSEVCSLNLTDEHSRVNMAINNPKKLTDYLINNHTLVNREAGYIVYKDNNDRIKLDDKLIVSSKFSYQDELFSLEDTNEVTSQELYQSINNKDYYMCQDTECRYLYHITSIEEESIAKEDNSLEEEDTYNYYLTKFDTLMAYQAGETGLRKINNNYVYVGDNPDNYLYFNCQDELNTGTCELWRIIGFTYDLEKNEYYTRIIKDDYLDKLSYSDNSSIWNDSNIYNYLSKEYKLNNQKYLLVDSYRQENILDLDKKMDEITFLTKEYQSNIRLMNISDYLLGSTCNNLKLNEYDSKCLTNNWLNKNISEWTMTSLYEVSTEDENKVNNNVYVTGNELTSEKVTTELFYRPVVNLKNRVLLVNGDGTIDNPFEIR